MNIKSNVRDEGLVKGVQLLAQESGKNVGFLVGEITPGETALIENINVQPSHRNQGVGSALIGFFKELARQHNCQIEGDFRPDTTIKEGTVKQFYKGQGLKIENGKIKAK